MTKKQDKEQVTSEDKNEAQDAPARDLSLTRRKVNRGSTRRITAAMDAFDKACDAFIKEMDLQFYVADENGNRVAEWDFVGHLKEMKAGVRQTVNDELHPTTAEETEAVNEE